MAEPLTLVAISGSLRTGSYNTSLLDNLPDLAPAGLTFRRLEIGNLPVYDGDLELDGVPPAEVVALQRAIRASDGLVIATPEYNHGIPGSLKNALDWLSRGAAPHGLYGVPSAMLEPRTAPSARPGPVGAAPDPGRAETHPPCPSSGLVATGAGEDRRVSKLTHPRPRDFIGKWLSRWRHGCGVSPGVNAAAESPTLGGEGEQYLLGLRPAQEVERGLHRPIGRCLAAERDRITKREPGDLGIDQAVDDRLRAVELLAGDGQVGALDPGEHGVTPCGLDGVGSRDFRSKRASDFVDCIVELERAGTDRARQFPLGGVDGIGRHSDLGRHSTATQHLASSRRCKDRPLAGGVRLDEALVTQPAVVSLDRGRGGIPLSRGELSAHRLTTPAGSGTVPCRRCDANDQRAIVVLQAAATIPMPTPSRR